jgi:hypothetical protein
MKRALLALVLGLALGACGAYASPSDNSGDRACCKVCTAGRACGNTCIAAYKTCHVGPGCACDAR